MASQHMLFIKDFTGKTHTIYCDFTDTIGDMKRVFEEKIGYPAGLRYVCGKKQYDDDSLLITEIKYDSTIQICGRLC
jgi:hypothetical protein